MADGTGWTVVRTARGRCEFRTSCKRPMRNRQRTKAVRLTLGVLACFALYALVAWMIVKNYQGF